MGALDPVQPISTVTILLKGLMSAEVFATGVIQDQDLGANSCAFKTCSLRIKAKAGGSTVQCVFGGSAFRTEGKTNIVGGEERSLNVA